MPDRHLADLRGNREPGRDHPRGGSDRGDRVRPRRPGRPGQHRIRRQRPTPPSEHRADRLDPGCEAPQPAAHRRRRPVQPGRDPAVPQPNGLRRERRPDHRRGVRAPDQHQHRKQHMRHPTAGAPRPPRDDPYRAARAADRPRAGPTPPGQRPHAPRTRQPARTQPFLDRAGVDLYREHRASERNHTALPHAPGQGQQRHGRGLPRPEDRHGGGADEHGQHDSPRPNRIHTLNGANQPLRRHPRGRLTLNRERVRGAALLRAQRHRPPQPR